MFYYRSFTSSLSTITLAEDSQGIFLLWLGDADEFFFKAVQKLIGEQPGTQGGKLTAALKQELEAYFEGTLKAFTVPLSFYGTEFQKSVWKQIAGIPFGEMITYGHIAQVIGNPQSCRAVGGATGKNPIPIVVPCHRVVGKSGALTGFSAPGGLQTKIKLLKIGRAHV